jgi:hypothetical protein
MRRSPRNCILFNPLFQEQRHDRHRGGVRDYVDVLKTPCGEDVLHPLARGAPEHSDCHIHNIHIRWGEKKPILPVGFGVKCEKGRKEQKIEDAEPEKMVHHVEEVRYLGVDAFFDFRKGEGAHIKKKRPEHCRAHQVYIFAA